MLTRNSRLLLAAIFLLPLLFWSSSVFISGFTGSLIGIWACVSALCGLGWLFSPQRKRLAQAGAWLGLLGCLLAVISLLQWAPLSGLLLLLLGLGGMLASGYGSVLRADSLPGLPPVKPSLTLAVKVLLDEIVMGYFIGTLRFPKGAQRQRVIGECRDALTVLETRGYLDKPKSLHPEPAVPASVQLTASGHKHHRYNRLSFDNPLPDLQLPGTPSWLRQSNVAQARIFEHEGESRPWLMCIHGYRMGWLPLDFQLFPPGWLHHKLGFNLIMPILPLHGARKQGWRSGDGLFDGDTLRMLHAIMQSVYDLRCMLAWLREAKQAQDIAVLGYSLGGFHAAMLACLESRISTVVAGIPLVDLPTVIWEHAPRSLIAAMEDQGMQREQLERLLLPLSPLAMTPELDSARLSITASICDRIVPTEPVIQLGQHWGLDEIQWFAGSHLSVRREAAVRDALLGYWQQAITFPALQTQQVQQG